MLLVAEADLARTLCLEDVVASAVASEEVEVADLGAADQMQVSDVVEASRDLVEEEVEILVMARLALCQSRYSALPLAPL